MRIFLVLVLSLCIKITTVDAIPTPSGIPYRDIKHTHIFGDSHARFSFQNIPGCTIHWLGPITMHRVGRDGLAFLNLLQYGVQEDETAIFVFGEIDVRCHIAKQCAAGRNLKTVVATLVKNYIATILKNKELYHSLHCIIFAVLPPSNASYNPEYPYQGTLHERITFTMSLNQELHLQCKAHGIYVLDVAQNYKTSEGYLDPNLSDGSVHIGPNLNGPVQQKLHELLAEIYEKT